MNHSFLGKNEVQFTGIPLNSQVSIKSASVICLNAERKTDWAYEKCMSTYEDDRAHFKNSKGYSGRTQDVVTDSF